LLRRRGTATLVIAGKKKKRSRGGKRKKNGKRISSPLLQASGGGTGKKTARVWNEKKRKGPSTWDSRKPVSRSNTKRGKKEKVFHTRKESRDGALYGFVISTKKKTNNGGDSLISLGKTPRLKRTEKENDRGLSILSQGEKKKRPCVGEGN